MGDVQPDDKAFCNTGIGPPRLENLHEIRQTPGVVVVPRVGDRLALGGGRSTGQLVGATLNSWHQEVVDGRADIRQTEIRARFVSTSCRKVCPLSAEQFRKGLR